ncbi:AraC family transcriptional regulator [Noviherbaspirillum sp. ST9]|uniref:AraC family transcriptional regulator n=1 Tax=Noviherbaspirillum sp. ST9 TaxID=3401606 RepID=UPI003B58A054
MSEQTTSASWVRGIAERLKSVGLDVNALFAEAQLDLASLDNPDTRYDTEKISLLWELAAARSGDPFIGLAMPGPLQPAAFDVVAYAMMTCKDLHTGVDFLVRYQRVVSDAVMITMEDVPEGCWIGIELAGGKRPVPRHRIDFVFTTLQTFFRWITGTEMHPNAVEFTHAAPAETATYTAVFQCPVRFNAHANRLLFSHADLRLPLQAANPVLAELHDRFAGERLAKLEKNRTSIKARESILRRLPEGDPARADVARELCMSERTLQRRLAEEGTSFHQMVDEARRELAQRYLNQPQLGLAQVASRLGFTDRSTFSRACKRWFDLTPTEYRSRLQSER